MATKFLVRSDPPNGEWSAPLLRSTAIRRTRRLLRKRGTRFILRKKGGGTLIRGVELAGTIERLKAELAKDKVGQTYILRGQLDKQPVWVRVIDTLPPPTNTPGTPAVDQFVAVLNERWPWWRNGGACVCKQTRPGVWSDHAYCAAQDVFDTPANMEAIRDFAVAHAEELQITYVILYDRIWVRGSGWARYTGTYHHHVHISFEHDGVRRACA